MALDNVYWVATGACIHTMYLWRIVKGALGVSVTGDELVSMQVLQRNVPPSSLALVQCSYVVSIIIICATQSLLFYVLISSLRASVSKQALPELRDYPNYLSQKSLTEVRKLSSSRLSEFDKAMVLNGVVKDISRIFWLGRSLHSQVRLNLKDHLSFFRLPPNEDFRGFPKNYEVF